MVTFYCFKTVSQYSSNHCTSNTTMTLVALPGALTTILLLSCSVSATLVSYSGDGNDTLKATSCKHNKVAHHHVNKVSSVGDYVVLDNDKTTVTCIIEAVIRIVK